MDHGEAHHVVQSSGEGPEVVRRAEELWGEAARLGARRNEAGAARFGRRGAIDELYSRQARREREEGEGDRREEKLPVLAKDKGDAHGG